VAGWQSEPDIRHAGRASISAVTSLPELAICLDALRAAGWRTAGRGGEPELDMGNPPGATSTPPMRSMAGGVGDVVEVDVLEDGVEVVAG
jgi:hypothetical protein